jgi:hypothetical protein
MLHPFKNKAYLKKFNLYFNLKVSSSTNYTSLAIQENNFTCIEDGQFAFNNCTDYYVCVYTNTTDANKYLMSCPSGSLFDNSQKICNWANQVNQVDCVSNETRLDINEYLTHYWPICRSDMSDQISAAHMQQGSTRASFIEDRFENKNSSLGLNGGWTRVPSGIYFNTSEFSIAVWVYPNQVDKFARVIDFGNGAPSDNVILSLDSDLNQKPFFLIYFGTQPFIVNSSLALTQNQWQHLTATFEQTKMSIYINASLTGSTTFTSGMTPQSIQRVNNYIGHCDWSNIGHSYSYLDELRFYNICLSQGDIFELIVSRK